MTNKNDNKSMFIYAALIFFVAVILIILSFFGQTHLEKSIPKAEYNTEQTQGITERAAVLSEENKNLMEENKQLKEKNKDLEQKQTTNDLLLSANGYFIAGNNEKAFEMLNAVDYNVLTSDQQIIYNNIKNNLQ
ncbi:MAG: hypothetical protein HFE49_03175 [Clostridia bacterium]|nr:hypothetical protein [Clostridia bacterium]